MSMKNQSLALPLVALLAAFALTASAQNGGIPTPDPLPTPVTNAAFNTPPIMAAGGGAGGAYNMHLADMDGDGDLDIVGSNYSGDANDVAWYENTAGDGSAWTEHVVATDVGAVTAALGVDADADGDMDILTIVRNVREGRPTVAFYENDGAGGWTEHIISDNFLEAYSAVLADVNGDGKVDFVSAAKRANKVAWFQNNGTLEGWTEVLVGEVTGPYGVATADMDNDGDIDVLTVSNTDGDVLWFENNGDGQTWTRHVVTDALSSPYHALPVDLNGDGHLDIAVTDYTANKVMAYISDGSPKNAGWTEVTVATNYLSPRFLEAGDIDLDGDNDLVCQSFDGGELTVFTNVDGMGGAWNKVTAATGITDANNVTVGDVDNDGDLDLVGAARGVDDYAFVRNDIIHRNATLPMLTTVTEGFQAADVDLVDIDGDGDGDIVAAGANGVSWFEQTALGWQAHSIDGALAGAVSVTAADVDGDGDMDVLATAGAKVVWYENNGSPTGAGWPAHVLASDLAGAADVAVGDLNQDGKLDVIAAGGASVQWYANNGTTTGWTAASVGALAGAASVTVGDFDKDGDLDVAAGGTAGVTVFSNNGAGVFTAAVASAAFTGATALEAADIDKDGDLDIVGASATAGVAYLENGATWTLKQIDAALAALDVAVADMDLDGDVDVVAAGADTVNLYVNNGATWATVPAAGTLTGSAAVAVAPADGDADPDVAVAISGAQAVGFLPNGGGQFALITENTSAGKIFGGEMDDVLKITMKHNGRAGDSDVELARVDLTLEGPDGAPLTTEQLNIMLTSLAIYADSGNGAFDASDVALTTLADPFLFNGNIVIEIPDGSADAAAAVGASKAFFVVAAMAEDAAQYVPAGFAATHNTETSSVGEDVTNDSMLALELMANVKSGLTYAGDQGPEILSITRHTPAREDASTTLVAFAVEFNEPVQGVTADNFSIVASGGQSTAAVNAVDGTNPIQWLVWIATGPGNGSLALRLDKNLSAITDLDGLADPLVAGLSDSEVYMIEFDKPISQLTAPASGTMTESLWTLEWTAADNGSAASGLETVVVYMVRNPAGGGEAVEIGSFPPEVTSTQFDAATYGGGTYLLYTVAIDKAGNVEAVPSPADVTIEISLPSSPVENWKRY